VEEIKPLFVSGSDGYLRHLILELLSGSPAVEQLTDELRQLVLTPDESENTRLLAIRCLFSVPSHDHLADLLVLISEASDTSMSLVAEAIETLGSEKFDRAFSC
jgi:HEAT repeat protein